MTPTLRLLPTLPAPHRERLMAIAREVSFPEDTRIFEAGGHADRFWVVRSGSVSLDQQVTATKRIAVATLGPGDLLGWSWLFPPHEWDFGAEAFSPVRAYEFGATDVGALCAEDPTLELSLTRTIAAILANRLEATRNTLLEHYVRHGGAVVR
ncbi:cyclic nucleotide-binding domain-containing protein [Streptomyces sp. NPDC008313]|uniref:cyclic nucleotide-binding domain-containing protein n=1 Tax=Streptomyces sp. NPDC008313 TaxID=3364826 RepID=UPI0036E6A064